MKVARLELQLNNEMEKISSFFSGFLEEIIRKTQVLPCFSLRAEMDRARAKREGKLEVPVQVVGYGDPGGEEDDNNCYSRKEISPTRPLSHSTCPLCSSKRFVVGMRSNDGLLGMYITVRKR
jgi:hypothetical protein